MTCRCSRPIDVFLLDYCAKCDTELCSACMKKGCCDEVPALSGLAYYAEGKGIGEAMDKADREAARKGVG